MADRHLPPEAVEVYQSMLDGPIKYYDRAGVLITDPQRYFEVMDDREYKVVAQEDVGPYWVSTVWLGMDHNWWGDGPPLIFETMVFSTDGGSVDFGEDFDQRRYSTEVEAIEGHEATVLLVRASLLFDEG